jgi:hypothetical protein
MLSKNLLTVRNLGIDFCTEFLGTWRRQYCVIFNAQWRQIFNVMWRQ